MKSILLVAIVLSTLVLTGCPKGKPNVPPAIAQRIAKYELDRFNRDLNSYDCAAFGVLTEPNAAGVTCANLGVPNADSARAKLIRDRVIDRLKANIDALYNDFEEQLFTRRAGSNLLFDITELGSAAAINITNGERAKNIISVALAAFKGGRKSLDENFFKERTIQTIISQMQASRAQVEGVIIQKRGKEVAEYSLDEALGDLVNYFYAGTLQKGLQNLAKEAGQNAINAEKRVLQLKNIDPGSVVSLTPDVRGASVMIGKYRRVFTTSLKGTAAQKQEATEKLRLIYLDITKNEGFKPIVEKVKKDIPALKPDMDKLEGTEAESKSVAGEQTLEIISEIFRATSLETQGNLVVALKEFFDNRL
ncbi:MAG TPA: hypothetical protein VJ842_18635 [Pyrinomonadaceae bacterium]|nr:hypothetical protein [Pyrinomonadaceae bacterium]